MLLCFIFFISVLVRQTTGAPNVQVNFVNNLVASVSIDQVIPVGAVSEVSDDGNLEKNSKTAVFDEVNKSNKERAVWLCVYSTHDLTLIKPANTDFFKNKNFYFNNILDNLIYKVL